MLSYDLAKKLKDAGFPRMDVIRDGEEFQLNAKSSQQGRYSDDDRDFHLDSDGVRLPTLEELIEACVKLSPDGDFHLEHLYDEWAASFCWLNDKTRKEGRQHDESWQQGDTPTEAVANLWLKLHENKSK